MFSVLILTLNEEKTLPSCLASLRGCDDVVVLDSGSTDRTAAIAAAAGARVVVHPFENFARQRNFAHEAIKFRHPWVFHLDADEQLTEELRSECAAHTASELVDGCYAAPRMLWEGRWIPHCTDYPAWQARFVKARGFTFVQAGHGQREAPQMRMGRLRANYLHNLSVDGASGWLVKHHRYARQEAEAFLAGHESIGRQVQALLVGPELARRRSLKQLSYCLPGRPMLRFFYQYVLRGGFRDGGPGYRYCRLLARYEGFADQEIRRLRADRSSGSGAPTAPAVQSRVVFLNRFYWPDEAATAQLLTDLAEGLAARGQPITVITSHDGNPETARRETNRGVDIIRVPATRWGQRRMLAKAIDHATFALGIRRAVRAEVRTGDWIVAMTDPPALAMIAAAAARRTGVGVIHWLQDLHPEIALALWPSTFLKRLCRPWIRRRNAAWKQAKACVAISRDMATAVGESGVSAKQIRVIPNWAPGGDALAPVAHERNLLRQQWELEGKFVAAYSGNIGRVHIFHPLLAAAALLRDKPEIVFLFVGTGPRRKTLELQARRQGLTNVRFQPAQPRTRLAESLSVADVHLVTLRPGCEQLVYPSKLYGIAAVARPLVYVGPLECDLARTIQQVGFGVAVSVDAPASLALAIRGLQADPERRAAMGNAAARWARDTGGLTSAVTQWEELLGIARSFAPTGAAPGENGPPKSSLS
jgi:glycosyltransferase involved in cell wall biosynthesis